MYEEMIVLILAVDETAATRAAHLIGADKEQSYGNMYGQTVTWKLFKVAEVQEILDEQSGHGTEVFSRHFYRDIGDKSEFEYE